MLRNEIETFGKLLFIQSLTSLKTREFRTPEQAIIGAIDFEYYKKRLISVQLSIEGRTKFILIDAKLSETFDIDNLKGIILDFLDEIGIKYRSQKKPKHLYLASYYSTAELSMLKDFWNKSSVRHVMPKIVNVSFPLLKRKTERKGKRHDGLFFCSIIDIYHFFTDMKTPEGKKELRSRWERV